MKKLKLFQLLIMALFTMFIFTQCKDKKGDEPIPPDEKTIEVTEIQQLSSCDTIVFKKQQLTSSITSNWVDPFTSDEAALLKLSVAEQQSLISQVKAGNKGTALKVYVSGVTVLAATTGMYSAIMYSGDQNKFEEVARGVELPITVIDKKWLRTYLKFTTPIEIKGKVDLFVGSFVTNVATKSYPYAIADKNPAFPGRTAKYPSYGFCPKDEMYLQELNDPLDKRWSVDNANWVMKIHIAKEATL